VNVNNPHRKVVLFPLKSLRYHNSSDCKRTVPGSIGAKELGECVTAPAMLMSEETYFLMLGKSLHPDVKKQDPNNSRTAKIFKALGMLLRMMK